MGENLSAILSWQTYMVSESSTAFNISVNDVNIFLTTLFKAEDQETPQWWYFDSQNYEDKSSLIYS